MSTPFEPGQLVRLARMGNEIVIGEILWVHPDGRYRVDIDPAKDDLEASTIVCARHELIPIKI